MAFTDIAGQEDFKKRLAKEAQNPHIASYLLTGPVGIGKHTFAREFAKAMLCENPSPAGACGTCKCCKYTDAGTNPDLKQIFKPEKTVNIKMEDLRDATDDIDIRPQFSPRRVWVIDLDYLQAGGQNLLLKPTEDPPPHAVFILLSSSPSSVIATVKSRALTLEIPKYDREDIRKILDINVPDCDEEKKVYATKFSDGIPGRAINLVTDTDFADIMDGVFDLVIELPQMSYTEALSDRVNFLKTYKDRLDDVVFVFMSVFEDLILVKSAPERKNLKLTFDDKRNLIEKFVTENKKFTAGTVGRLSKAVENFREMAAANVKYEAAASVMLLDMLKEFK